MLAMSRQYGSLPLMGCWPPLSSSGADSASVEAQMKVLELAHHGSGPSASMNTGFNSLACHAGASNASHLSDPYVQALMMARSV
jgi:hypothetical protein